MAQFLDYAAFPLPLTTQPKAQSVAWWQDAFTFDEIEWIKALGARIGANASTIGGQENMTVAEADSIRRSDVAWIAPNTESQWLYERMGLIARNLNVDYFGFDLYGCEALQFTVYSTAGSHYDWHVDNLGASPDRPSRKLTLVVQLDDPLSYEGGDLIVKGAHSQVVPKAKGLVFAFPSWTLHKVTPVTSGLRRTLVMWATGPAFR